jgi:hypothetical protein
MPGVVTDVTKVRSASTASPHDVTGRSHGNGHRSFQVTKEYGVHVEAAQVVSKFWQAVDLPQVGAEAAC